MSNIEDFITIYKQNGNDTDFDVDGLEYEIIEEGEWEQDHKYQHRDILVRYNGTHIMVNENRSGSYHTDWYYGDTLIYEVYPVDEVKTVRTWHSTGPHFEVAGE
jgi:hypothetical protein